MSIDEQELESKVREILMRILSETRLSPISGTTAVVPAPGTTITIYTGPVGVPAGLTPDIEPFCVPVCPDESIGEGGIVAELPLDEKSNALLEKIGKVTGQSRQEILDEIARRIREQERAAKVAAAIETFAEELGVAGSTEDK